LKYTTKVEIDDNNYINIVVYENSSNKEIYREKFNLSRTKKVFFEKEFIEKDND
jgi:hypothetical protein